MQAAQIKTFALKDLGPERWKNGGGVTCTIASASSDNGPALFDWRISVARIEESGAFSVFPGVDRIAVVLENGPLKLSKNFTQGGVSAPLYLAEELVPIQFAGDSELFADISGPPISCLNIMTRRGKAQASVELLDTDGTLSLGRQTVVFVAGSIWRLSSGSRSVAPGLAKNEGAILLGGGELQVSRTGGPGKLIVIHLNERHADQDSPGVA